MFILCRLMYIGNCDFTLLSPIPMQHYKANSIFLPFCICSLFSHSEKPDFHYTCLISVPTCNQPPISTTNLYPPTSQYGWSPNPTQATTAMLGYYYIHLSCVDILLHPGLGNMYHSITPCGCPPHPYLGFDPYFWAIVVSPSLHGCLPCSAPMNGFGAELGFFPSGFIKL